MRSEVPNSLASVSTLRDAPLYRDCRIMIILVERESLELLESLWGFDFFRVGLFGVGLVCSFDLLCGFGGFVVAKVILPLLIVRVKSF